MTLRQYQVVESEQVFADYVAIALYIEQWSEDRTTADRTVDAIRQAVRSLATFPQRGAPRDELLPGLRLLPFGKHTAIAFTIDERAREVQVLRVFFAGQDVEAIMREQPDSNGRTQ